MKIDITTSNELWDLEEPFNSRHSRLFYLEPIGIGTCYVESLTSYIARLAEAHSVLPGVLLALEVKPLLKGNYFINSSNSPSIGTLYAQDVVKALNGTGSGALQLVKALETLTLRTDLQFLTMLFWAEVVPTLGLLKHFQSWCPKCYQEWQSSQQVVYSPLLWALDVVKVCPYHHQLLESQCPHCHKQFVPLWRNSRPGFCLKCFGWLGTSFCNYEQVSNINEKEFDLQWEIWVANTLGELIAKPQEFQFSPNRETIKKAFSAYIHHYTNGNASAFGCLLEISKHEILHWNSGTSIPKLDKLLKICYRLSTNLVDFLQLKVIPKTNNHLALKFTKQRSTKSVPTPKTNYSRSQVIEAMQLALKEYPPPTLTELALRLGFKTYNSLSAYSKSLSTAVITRYANYRRQLSQELIQNILKSVLNSDEFPPPSLSEVARRNHVSLATFYRYGSDLCQTISVRYNDYRKLLQKQIIELGCEEVRQLAPKLHAQGINPTVKNISKFMNNPSALWHKEVVETLNQARRFLDE